MMDPLRHFSGYEELLDCFRTCLTDIDAYRSSQVSHEWRNWIKNASSLWRRLFAAQHCAFVEGMYPYVVYRTHRSMKYDLERLVEGINSIMGDEGSEGSTNQRKAEVFFATRPKCMVPSSRNPTPMNS